MQALFFRPGGVVTERSIGIFDLTSAYDTHLTTVRHWCFQVSHIRVTSNKACSNNLAMYPSSVITTDVSVSMIAKTYSNSFTPVNIKSGLQKLGV